MSRSLSENSASATKNDTFSRASGSTQRVVIVLGANHILVKENDCPFSPVFIATCIGILSTSIIFPILFKTAFFAEKTDTIDFSLSSSVQPLPHIDSNPCVDAMMQEGDFGCIDVMRRRPIVPSFSSLIIQWLSCAF